MKKWFCLLASVLLVGCAQKAEALKIDTKRMDADSISLDYEIRKSEKGTGYDCIKTQTIQGTLIDSIADFDEKIRKCDGIETVPAVDGAEAVGVYSLRASQKNGKGSRWLKLDPGKIVVTFSGEIGEISSYAYLEIKSDLKPSFDQLVSELKAIVDSVTDIEYREC